MAGSGTQVTVTAKLFAERRLCWGGWEEEAGSALPAMTASWQRWTFRVGRVKTNGKGSMANGLKPVWWWWRVWGQGLSVNLFLVLITLAAKCSYSCLPKRSLRLEKSYVMCQSQITISEVKGLLEGMLANTFFP